MFKHYYYTLKYLNIQAQLSILKNNLSDIGTQPVLLASKKEPSGRTALF